VDASLLTNDGVGWRLDGHSRRGARGGRRTGFSNTEKLFVPFYTTKPGGTGIGLSRQIAEAHGGTLTLENRTPEPGCEALLRLPV
jgi:nitrogen fixation/metabolism regulation signal transduction histidine kinase